MVVVAVYNINLFFFFSLTASLVRILVFPNIHSNTEEEE